MNIVFCKGCGKELHESAPACPNCGFVQSADAKVKDSVWMAITAFVSGVLCLLNWFNLPDWDADMETGLWLFSILALAFGTISLLQKRGLKVLSIFSVAVAGLTILILIGRI